MIYNLILFKHYDSFARVKLESEAKTETNIRFKDLIYKIIDIDGKDLIVVIL